MAYKIEKCKGSPDFELNIGFDREIKYHIVSPSKKSDGIIFFISCFGLDNDYIIKWLKKAADNFNMHAVSVEYHCYQSRPETNAKIIATKELELKIKGLCKDFNIKNDTINDKTLTDVGNKLPIQMQFNDVILKPKNGDYQNFGVMQALDHLYVISDLIKKIKTNFNNIILFGSSHGGYIAHMIAKLAPKTIKLIIDNSSYVMPPPNYMGLGAEYIMVFGNLILGCSIDSCWQHERQHENNYYDISKKLIRDVANKYHLQECAKNGNNLKIIAYNAEKNDYISYPKYKKYQQKVYFDNGFDYNLILVNKKKLGKIFKSLNHGMNVSLWNLALDNKKYIIGSKNNNLKIDYLNKTELYFNCYNAKYKIKHNYKGLPVYIEILKERNI